MPTDAPADAPARRRPSRAAARARRRASARISALIAIAATVTLGAGWAGESRAADDERGPVDGAAGAPFRDAVPGLYVPDDVVARIEPSGTVTLGTMRSCTELDEILLAGDWQRTQRLDVAPEVAPMLAIGGLRPMTLLRQGADHALLRSDDRDGGCRTSIALAADGPVAVDAGTAIIDGDGWAHAARCMSSDSMLFVSLLVGGDGLSGVMQLVIDGDAGERVASLDDSTDSMLAIGPVGVLDALSAALATELAGGDPGSGGGVAVVDGSGTSGRATIDVTAATPRGTVEISGANWYDDASGESGPLTLTAPFVCPELTTVP